MDDTLKRAVARKYGMDFAKLPPEVQYSILHSPSYAEGEVIPSGEEGNFNTALGQPSRDFYPSNDLLGERSYDPELSDAMRKYGPWMQRVNAEGAAPTAPSSDDMSQWPKDKFGTPVTPSGWVPKEFRGGQGQEQGQSQSALASPAPPSSPLVPSGADIVWNRMLGDESGGHQFDRNGNPLTSPKGAIGIAQVLPATGQETAAKHGVPWDTRRFYQDADYNKMLGKMYYGDQLETFKDPALAAAAYNAGPGAVTAALQRGRETGTSWLGHLPRETQAYVAATTGGKRGGGGGGANGPDAGSLWSSLSSPSSGPVTINYNAGAPPSPPSPPINPAAMIQAEMKLQLLRNLFPQHGITPVEYDPWKIYQQEQEGQKRAGGTGV